MKKKIAIVGSRNISNYSVLENHVLSFIDIQDIECIISGGAKGVDYLAEMFAEEHNLEMIIFPADWKKYGKSAGPRRNVDIVTEADIVFVLWDGKSTGTKNSIDLAAKLNKELHIKIIT